MAAREQPLAYHALSTHAACRPAGPWPSPPSLCNCCLPISQFADARLFTSRYRRSSTEQHSATPRLPPRLGARASIPPSLARPQPNQPMHADAADRHSLSTRQIVELEGFLLHFCRQLSEGRRLLGSSQRMLRRARQDSRIFPHPVLPLRWPPVVVQPSGGGAAVVRVSRDCASASPLPSVSWDLRSTIQETTMPSRAVLVAGHNRWAKT